MRKLLLAIIAVLVAANITAHAQTTSGTDAPTFTTFLSQASPNSPTGSFNGATQLGDGFEGVYVFTLTAEPDSGYTFQFTLNPNYSDVLSETNLASLTVKLVTDTTVPGTTTTWNSAAALPTVTLTGSIGSNAGPLVSYTLNSIADQAINNQKLQNSGTIALLISAESNPAGQAIAASGPGPTSPSFSFAVVPEPATGMMFGIGVLVVFVIYRKRRSRSTKAPG